jgi:hypothetical protein
MKMHGSLCSCSYDGVNFINNIEAGVEDRLKKRGKPPRIVRFFYCGWAHALMVSLQSVVYIIAPGLLAFLHNLRF